MIIIKKIPALTLGLLFSALQLSLSIAQGTEGTLSSQGIIEVSTLDEAAHSPKAVSTTGNTQNKINTANFANTPKQVNTPASVNSKSPVNTKNTVTINATTPKASQSEWYTAKELRAQRELYAEKLPYDFGLGVVTDGDVADNGEVSLNVKMKPLFGMMPVQAQDQFLKTSLAQLNTRYCKDVNSNKKRLSKIRAIHGVVLDNKGKILLKRTFTPSMCQKQGA